MSTAAYAIAITRASDGKTPPDWIQLLPSGQFAGKDGRGPWLVQSAESVIKATRQYAGSTSIPIDYEHQIDNSPKNGKPAPAAGWIKGLQARADGIWGLVEWTKRAGDLIQAKEYLYISPVFHYDKLSGKVQRILRAALTNNPALNLTALARAEDENMEEMNEFDQFKATLLEALGLNENDDLETILNRIKELTGATETSSAIDQDYVPIGEHQQLAAKLTVMEAQREEEAVENLVSNAIRQNHIPPTLANVGMALCRADRSAFDEMVSAVSPFLRSLRGMQTGGKAPEERYPHGSLTETQLSICSALGRSPENYASNR